MKSGRANFFDMAECHAVMGIDLAALPKNPTGICMMYENKISLDTVYGDEEIMEIIRKVKMEVIAIDAPLMEEVKVRDVDKLLKKYGAMPPTMKGMRKLTERAWELLKKIEKECDARIIEVFPTATAKILGIYSRKWKEMRDILGIEARNKHELDAYLCALTACLYREGRAIEVGKDGKVVVPLEYGD